MMNRVKLLDDDGHPVEPGTVGELFSNSPCLFLGYWNNPQATTAAMRDDWFSAGDLAWQDEDGCYYIVDRKKDMYIAAGSTCTARSGRASLPPAWCARSGGDRNTRCLFG